MIAIMAKKNGTEPLFVTEKVKGRILYRLFATSIFVAIVFVWVYRVSHIPSYSQEDGIIRILVWIGMLLSELWFGFYWFLTQSVRWNRVHRRTFPHRLSQRYSVENLPKVDIFVCTADPEIEPPVMVINTVLSVMAYDYPPENLSIYLSDDAGSEITFYALLEASRFSKYWLPYCKKFSIEPRSPASYFESLSDVEISDANHAKEFASIKKLYQEMENRIEVASKLGRVVDRGQHRGFVKWDSSVSRGNHDTILQILIDGRDQDAKDIAGCTLPTLVYLAREKRPQHFHNFKAGAMNALIRVSSGISNAPVILNVDCDMHSNNSESIREALCFFMDEKNGHEIAYVQFPQMYKNMTKNDLYGSCMTVIREVEFPGIDGYGGPLYVGSGCFHRREILCGRKFRKDDRIELKNKNVDNESMTRNIHELEQKLSSLASCSYEVKNTKWGKEMGLKYGCPVEDVITGLSIQCQGWKSVYCNPNRAGFLGIAATTLDQILVQQKRWSEGDLQILLSKYSPAWYGLGKISPPLSMAYCIYCLWSPNCLATLYYSIIPSLYLLKRIPLFPQPTNPWFIPFGYLILAVNSYSLGEFLWSGGTIQGWWNEQRMWLYKRTSSYLFAFLDTVLKLMGFTESKFVISNKLLDENVSRRYNEEVMEFGNVDSPMITILSSMAVINLFCFLLGVVIKIMRSDFVMNLERMVLQVLCCGILVMINLPLYNAILFRKDEGRMSSSVTGKSVFLAIFVCTFSCFYTE